MRTAICTGAVLLLAIGAWGPAQTAPAPQAAPPAAAQSAPAAQTKIYQAQCATCHGPDMTGGSVAGIRQYIRYHTDVEVAGSLALHKPPVTLAEGELRTLLSELRGLAGTNPAMATSGLFVQRGAGAGEAGAAPAGRGGRGGRGRGFVVPPSGPRTITLRDGRTLTGRVMAESEFDATLLADGRFHLLSKAGQVFSEKPIEPKSDWLVFGGSVSSGRYRALDQINRDTVQKLGVAWIFPMVNSPRLEVTPVVVDGIMYVTGWNEIFALDATTGRQLWTYNQPRTEGLLSEAGTGANRGAAIGGDKVFMVTDHAHLLGFNRFTGEKLWDAELGSIKEGYSAPVAPLVAGNLVIQGVSGGEEGVRGLLDAYDASTGKRVWRFYTVPRRGEKGSETWIGQAIDHGCGATWQTGSYDPALELIYWGVGNPCPDYTGDERLGDNLYTSSVVALSARTGELAWHYQFSPHDTHDWDAAQPMVLVDDVWKGRPRKLLFNANRNGMFYVFDRTNGEVLLVDKLSTKVTWHKGFTPDGKPIVDPGSIATRQGVAVCPGGSGGANMPDVSYSQQTKLFYVKMSDSCATFASSDDPLSGNRWFGRGTAGEQARKDLEALRADYPGGYFIRAMNPFTGKKAWEYPVPFGHEGLLSTGGGLVFSGTTSGGLMALDARSGTPVWHVNIGQVLSQASPMTYMVGGRQYISLAGQGQIVAYTLSK